MRRQLRRDHRVITRAPVVRGSPPLGAVVSVLPTGHSRVMLGKVPHFYHGGVYYRRSGSGTGGPGASGGRDPRVTRIDPRLLDPEFLAARRDAQLNEISDRYKGRESMLVQLPTGGEVTLKEAMDSIIERKWWRG